MYKMAHALLGFLCLSIIPFATAQTDVRLAQTRMPLKEVARLQLPTLDNDALLEAELEARVPGRAPGFAKNIAVDISPETHGSWSLATNGQQVWRLRISSPTAKSINLGFDQFDLPAGAQLLLYSPDYKTVLGPFTPADEEDHGELWTPVLPGDEIVIEMQIPPVNRTSYALHLKSVNHDFLGFGDGSAFLSGSCNVDVICGSEDGFSLIDRYRDVIQSVAVYSLSNNVNSRLCTGFLVSNTRGDCTPLFLTANHCGVNANNAASLVVYWNYFNDSCRQPNSPASGAIGNGDLSDFNTGAIHRASYSPSDVTLLELDDPVSPTADAWFAGWDASDVVTTDTVLCIHHPNTEEKRISFEFDGTSRADIGGNNTPDGNFLRVADWDIGTTEGGSSGSPLFNKQGQVIGQLFGGAAACGNDQYDVYGWLHISWVMGGLRPWLDPDNTGILVQDGYDQVGCSLTIGGEPRTQAICTSETATYQLSVSSGFENTVSLSVINLAPGLAAAFTNSSVPPGGMTELRITGTENVNEGVYTFTVLANDGANTTETELSFTLNENIAEAPSLVMPADDSTLGELNPTLTWMVRMGAESYDLQVATDSEFNFRVLDLNTTNNTIQTPALVAESTYYWRVRSHNACGVSEWSDSWRFTLPSVACSALSAEDTPIVIGAGPANVIESSITINSPGAIVEISITNLDITHSFVGDLDAALRSPQGTTIQLFNRPRGGGCGGNDLLLAFNDEASATSSDFGNTCNNNPAISGTFQPVDPFGIFIGESALGEWTLTIQDNAGADGGSLNDWALNLCTDTEGLQDITIIPEAPNVETCLLDEFTFTLSIGEDFGNNPTVSVTQNGNTFGNATNSFNNSTRTLTLNWPNFIGEEPGAYPLTITVDGEGLTNSTVVNFTLLSAPASNNLVSPVDNAQVDLENIILNWTAADTQPIDLFIVEIARDEGFTDIALTQETTETTITVQLETEAQYYWRVTARNECGQVLSDFRRFDALLVGTHEIGEASLRVFPNPTRERVQVELTLTIGGQLDIQLYSTSGQIIKQWQLPAQAGRQSLELNAVPAGVYWLRIRNADHQAVEKLVVY